MFIQEYKPITPANKLFQKIALDIQTAKEYMQNVGRALKRREEEEVKGVQSAVRILTETQKYINIVFSKDVELAASFAGESSSLALTETENKKLERLDKEREKKNSAGSQFKKPKIDKSNIKCYACGDYGHYAGSLECVYTVRQYAEAGEPQKTAAKGQHAIGWTR